MSAEMREEIGGRCELLVKIDGRNAPPRSDRQLAVDADGQRRPVITLRDASGRQSENAFVPPVASQNVDPVRGRGANHRLRLLAHGALDLLPFGIEAIELRAKRPRRFLRRRREEIDGRFCRGEASGGIDARTDFEADVYSS